MAGYMRLALTSSSNEGRFFFFVDLPYMLMETTKDIDYRYHIIYHAMHACINKVIGDIYLRAKVINNTLLRRSFIYLILHTFI